jgi:thiamine biosynthesis lipoprotein
MRITGQAHGTTYSVVFQGDTDDLTANELDSLFQSFDLSLSTYIPNSLISQLNRSDTGMYVDTLFERMYHTAKTVHKKSDGAFDITVAPLVNVYGFGYTDKTEKIDTFLIDSILKYVGMHNIRLENSFLYKSHPLTEIDGNAIAKGLSVDNTADFLREKGIENFLVEIGGEIVAEGKKNNRKWIVGIDQPIDGNFEPGAHLQAKISLKDKALATSGNYRRFYEQDGKKYAHTIDPKTGMPVLTDLLSVTITAPDCLTADAYATACMAMGLEKSKALINSLPELEAYFISSDLEGNFVVDMTEGMKEIIIE